MASGAKPAKGYNHANLYLIPKDDTLLPQDTRPISVTNADNRICAYATTVAITPALQEMVSKWQTGFIHGRTSFGIIRYLNKLFYEAVEDKSKENVHLLFLDWKKAFDSINHDYLKAALAQFGMPEWVCKVVDALLHLPAVNCFFGGPTKTWIDILRGVKQGCPLSPVLFIICLDPLLKRLNRKGTLRCLGFADDLANATTKLTDFNYITLAVGKFECFGTFRKH